MPLFITPQIVIGDEDLEWKFMRSSGPGGQNVNKVSSAVQLRFLLGKNTALTPPAQQRLRRIAGQKLTDDGRILIAARGTRSQDQNRREALGRLETMIRQALVEPKIRKKTKPTRASRERRIEAKKKRGNTKRQRQGSAWD